MPSTTKYLTLHEAAEYLQVSERWLLEQTYKRRIRFTRFPRQKPRFIEDDLREFSATFRQDPEAS